MRAISFALALSLVLLSTAALADVPGLMNYQGTLTDSSGVALDTTVSMTFSINSDSVGGAQVWTENQSSVTVSHGLFNVLLGRVNTIPDTVFNKPTRWLGIQVGGNSELIPRQRIAAEGYALKAGDDGDWITSGGDVYRAAGKVGIGTAAPAYELDVAGDLKTSGAVLVGANRLELDPGFVRGNLRFQVNQLSLYGGTSGIALRDAGGTAKLTMLNDGSVGIGTETPAYELDVVGDLKTSGAVLVGANRLELDPGFARGNLRFQANQLVLYGGTSGIALHDASLNPRVTMLDNGNVGIGTTTPSYKLEVAGDLKATGAVLVGDNRLELDPGFLRGNLRFKSNQLSFYGGTAGIALLNASAAIKVIMLDDGSVGIGTTTPSYKLDVEGDVECTALHETSDERLKTDIEQLSDVLDRVAQIRGISFQWREEAECLGVTAGERDIGVIAQELEAVFPELVSSPEGNYKSVNYTKLTAVLIEAVKELRSENDDLKRRMEVLEKKNY